MTSKSTNGHSVSYIESEKIPADEYAQDDAEDFTPCSQQLDEFERRLESGEVLHSTVRRSSVGRATGNTQRTVRQTVTSVGAAHNKLPLTLAPGVAKHPAISEEEQTLLMDLTYDIQQVRHLHDNDASSSDGH